MAKRETEQPGHDTEAAELAKRLQAPTKPATGGLGPQTEASRRTERPEAVLPPPASFDDPRGQMTESVRYQATRGEKEAIEEFVKGLNRAGKKSLTVSNLLRACVRLLAHSHGEIARELDGADLKRPINDRRAILEYERRVAQALHAAFKKAPPLELKSEGEGRPG